MTKTGGGRKESVEPVKVRGRAEWRDWLESNHDKEDGVWLLVAKRGASVDGVTYEEAVEEALSFGWIDSTARAHDQSFFKQRFTPRRKGSGWSRSNRERVARLIERGQMTVAGTAKVEEAKADGSWNSLDAVDELDIPRELAQDLEEDPKANLHFHSLSPSQKKQVIRWVLDAKRSETRRRRIAAVISMASQGKRVGDLAEIYKRTD
jgi:uncharacterized protein YdeI (YjbR/CyaY-like superfamily)